MKLIFLFLGVVLAGCTRASQSVPAVADESLMLQNISASHPLIQYVGRIDFSDNEAPAFSHPGVNIRVRFTGTRLHVLLDDNAHRQSAETTNYFNVRVDGGESVRLKSVPSQKEYILAENLTDGEHEVELFKLSESSHGDDLNVGKVTIRGFRIDKRAEMLSVSTKAFRMEFVGDSITCGYGNELSSPNPIDDHFTTQNSNAYLAWGAVTARELNADYVAIAYSGRGVVRNYAGYESPTVPDVYLHTLPDDPDAAKWNPEMYIPDIVVINLGTNDFSEGLSLNREVDDLQRQYGERYETFVKELGSYYPKAAFVLAIGPMLSDSFPPSYNALSRVREELTRIVTTLAANGMNIHLLELAPQQAPFGEDFHPTVATHRRMADELVAFIQQKQLLMR